MNKKHVIDRNFAGQVSSSNLHSHSDPKYRSLVFVESRFYTLLKRGLPDPFTNSRKEVLTVKPKTTRKEIGLK